MAAAADEDEAERGARNRRESNTSTGEPLASPPASLPLLAGWPWRRYTCPEASQVGSSLEILLCRSCSPISPPLWLSQHEQPATMQHIHPNKHKDNDIRPQAQRRRVPARLRADCASGSVRCGHSAAAVSGPLHCRLESSVGQILRMFSFSPASASAMNQRWVLAKRPTTLPDASTHTLESMGAVPTGSDLKDGEMHPHNGSSDHHGPSGQVAL